MKRKHMEEGMVFGVPLEEGGYSPGVVARYFRVNRILLGYFYPRVNDGGENHINVGDLRPEHSIAQFLSVDDEYRSGRWPIWGKIPNWSRENWPLPFFIKDFPLGEGSFVIQLEDFNPFEELSRRLVRDPPKNLPCYSFISGNTTEFKLSRLLQQE